jgi:hypothetical protein
VEHTPLLSTSWRELARSQLFALVKRPSTLPKASRPISRLRTPKQRDKTVRGINKLIILCIAVYALAVTATAQTTWKLSTNVLATNNQISFNQGANGVWYFLQSSSFKHLPDTYQFLSGYLEPCVSPENPPIDGLACWRNPVPAADGNQLPLVGVNFTFVTQHPDSGHGDPFGIPARSVWMHPGEAGLGIIGWKSPITGSVNVAGFFSDLDPNCGNGIIWSVDIWSVAKGNSTLTTGTIANGGPPQTFSLTGVSIALGQVLYFTVDPKSGDYYCDSTGVDVTITQTK